MNALFVSDLHGHRERYNKLFDTVEREQPDGVFLGGDLLPSGLLEGGPDGPNAFVHEVLAAGFERLRASLGDAYPPVFVILGNDDGRAVEPALLHYDELGARPLWHYAHGRSVAWGAYRVVGYAYIPPSPFALKDWERYDVSRFVDPGCTSPESGYYSTEVPDRTKRTATIKGDLDELFGPRGNARRARSGSKPDADSEPATRPETTVGSSETGFPESRLDDVIILFHAPPYDTALDRAALDDTWVDHVPLDVHVGSIAIRRFIEARQPRITLHGHIHEAPRLTGRWHEEIAATHAFTAAHDGPDLAVVRFDPDDPAAAERELV
jgi:Icc-related predicted phosphoesterase